MIVHTIKNLRTTEKWIPVVYLTGNETSPDSKCIKKKQTNKLHNEF